jgi:hypothetical protein
MEHTDFATKRISSVSLSRSARAVASDRSGLYMLKKYSGTRSEKAWASIAENAMWLRALIDATEYKADQTHPRS